MTYPKRLIEVDLPIKRISAHSRREKSIRHGHISTLHMWWARRPLAACRAVICATLWPDPADENCPQAFQETAARVINEFAKKADNDMKLLETASEESKRRWAALAKKPLQPTKKQDLCTLRAAILDFIADFANWDNSTVKQYLKTARSLTQAAHEALGGVAGTRPLVVDPFAGGGSIPLEALRVGADAFASDLNPVAVLLNKVALEYIPKYGQTLADEVRKWGEWIKAESQNELGEFFPKDRDGAMPIAYLWARTIRCGGPGCGTEVPLLRSLWLAKKGRRAFALKLIPHATAKRIDIAIIENVKASEVGVGTVRRGSVTCPVCGYTTPQDVARQQFHGRSGGARDARLLAVVLLRPDLPGRFYRLARPNDIEVIKRAEVHIKKRPDEIPDEELPYLRSIFNINLLDVNSWGELFSCRQLVVITSLVRTLNRLRKHSDFRASRLRDATITCLALAVDRHIDQQSSLVTWLPTIEAVSHTFVRQALAISWDYCEPNPLSSSGGNLAGAIEWVAKVIEHECGALSHGATVEMASATGHPLPDDSAAVLFTDPPYYDAVPYADLSDFFYVWLKRMLSVEHSALFVDALTPKRGEIVQLAERNPKYKFKTKEYFEEGMTQALGEGRRVVQPSGLGVVVFAHKGTDAWETMLKSVLDAGWTVVASWPIDTERTVRLRARGSAALGSSVHLVCRPRSSIHTDEVGDWRDMLTELPRRIHEWMPRLAEEGVVGADAIFACLGPALEIFSRYSRVETASGEVVSLREYLEKVWAAVSHEALTMIFEGANTEGFEPDSRLTAMWLWTLSTGDHGAAGESDREDDEDDDDGEERGGKTAAKGGFVLEYDAARKIAQGLGARLEQLTSVVEVKGDKARLLPLAERTKHLFGKDEASAPTKSRKKDAAQMMFFEPLLEVEEEQGGWGDKSVPALGVTVLDRIHQSMILFAAGRSEALKRFLVEDGAGRDARYWRLAQALSALYPTGTDEKRWIEGILARKKGLGF